MWVLPPLLLKGVRSLNSQESIQIFCVCRSAHVLEIVVSSKQWVKQLGVVRMSH